MRTSSRLGTAESPWSPTGTIEQERDDDDISDTCKLQCHVGVAPSCSDNSSYPHHTAFMSADRMPAAAQFEGEIIDSKLCTETDHPERLRNRTTQSCLNCHTSKRKCDRKRPCQRCIQLGLTGLCVYEVDDPALREVFDIDDKMAKLERAASTEAQESCALKADAES